MKPCALDHKQLCRFYLTDVINVLMYDNEVSMFTYGIINTLFGKNSGLLNHKAAVAVHTVTTAFRMVQIRPT